MAEIIFKALGEIVEPKTLIVLIGLWFIYRQNKMLCGGVRAGLLAHIVRIHDGAVKNGNISKDALIIVSECYDRYKKCNGDGFADNLMKEIKELPTK